MQQQIRNAISILKNEFEQKRAEYKQLGDELGKINEQINDVKEANAKLAVEYNDLLEEIKCMEKRTEDLKLENA